MKVINSCFFLWNNLENAQQTIKMTEIHKYVKWAYRKTPLKNLLILHSYKVDSMKIPREIKTYCPKCQKHTVHSMERLKKRKASELKWGQRRFRRVTAGYGGFPRPKPEGREKPTKRIALVQRCKECKKAHQSPAIRAKKFEFKE
jgi:large subunit ribosomal protein L44e